MQWISIILNIILGIWGVYLYLENRKLKGFKIERDIRLKKLQILEIEIERDKIDYLGVFRCNLHDSIADEQKCEIKINKIKTEINYLQKIKKYKWLFNKQK